jgi:hypothetical protein
MRRWCSRSATRRRHRRLRRCRSRWCRPPQPRPGAEPWRRRVRFRDAAPQRGASGAIARVVNGGTVAATRAFFLPFEACRVRRRAGTATPRVGPVCRCHRVVSWLNRSDVALSGPPETPQEPHTPPRNDAKHRATLSIESVAAYDLGRKAPVRGATQSAFTRHRSHVRFL